MKEALNLKELLLKLVQNVVCSTQEENVSEAETLYEMSFEIANSQLLIALSYQWALGGALVKILCHSAFIFLSPGCRR